jgi:hypothetical protein
VKRGTKITQSDVSLGVRGEAFRVLKKNPRLDLVIICAARELPEECRVKSGHSAARDRLDGSNRCRGGLGHRRRNSGTRRERSEQEQTRLHVTPPNPATAKCPRAWSWTRIPAYRPCRREHRQLYAVVHQHASATTLEGDGWGMTRVGP